MSNDKYLGFQRVGQLSVAGQESHDPARFPDIRPGAKLLTFKEVIEIEKKKAQERREARAAAITPKM